MLLQTDFLSFNVRMSKCSACAARLIDCLLQRENFAWRKCRGLCLFKGVVHFTAHWQPILLCHSSPVAYPCSCSTLLLSDVQGFHFVNLTQWAWAGGGCTSAQWRILTVYFATSRKTKDVLLGPVFQVCISYSYQAPICPSLWLPQSQATGNEVLVWPEGGKKRAFVSPL